MHRSTPRIAALCGVSLLLTGANLSVYDDALPTTLHPLFAETLADERAQELVFDRLFFHSLVNSTLDSLLVERWELDDDGRNLSLTLKQGLRWHDGRAATAADVCFTVDVLLDAHNDTAVTTRYRPLLESCTVEGQGASARVTLREPLTAPPALLDFRLLPAHLFTGTTLAPDSPFARSPVGTGSMRGELRDGEVVFERTSPVTDPGQVVSLRILDGHGDSEAQVAALLAGEVDGVISVPEQLRREIALRDDLSLMSYHSTREGSLDTISAWTTALRGAIIAPRYYFTGFQSWRVEATD